MCVIVGFSYLKTSVQYVDVIGIYALQYILYPNRQCHPNMNHLIIV